jgi:hypothetical protein
MSDDFSQYVRDLFADPDAGQAEEPAEPRPTAGNVAPGEGNNPSSGPNDDMREFTRNLFRTTD